MRRARVAYRSLVWDAALALRAVPTATGAYLRVGFQIGASAMSIAREQDSRRILSILRGGLLLLRMSCARDGARTSLAGRRAWA